MPKDNNQDGLQQELWIASTKLRGLSELISSSDRDPALDEMECQVGIGMILREIGEQLDSWSKTLDTQQVRQTKKAPKKRQK